MMIKPNYNKSIISVSASILKHYNIEPKHKTIKELDKVLEKKYKNVVYLIIDALGYNLMNQHLSKKSFLVKNCVDKVTSTCPATTAVATTAIHNGMYPNESGYVGTMQYFEKYNQILSMFTRKNFYTKAKNENILPFKDGELPYKTIYEQILEKNDKVKYFSFFPKKAGGEFETFDEICSKIEDTCKLEDNKIISAYWYEPDHSNHHIGKDSETVHNLINDINNRVEKMSNNVMDTLFIIIADHGVVNVDEVYLNEYPKMDECLLMPPSIESRTTTYFIKKGKKRQFKKEFLDLFEDNFLLLTKNEFLKGNYLGTYYKNKLIESFIGDYISIAVKNKSIRYSITGERSESLISDHSGLTDDEMLVPLIIIERE